MLYRIREILTESPGQEYERLKWFVGLGVVVIFGSVYVGENVYLSGDIGYIYAPFVAFSSLAAVVILHYSGHRDKTLAKNLARWELAIGCALILSCIGLLLVIRHYNNLVKEEAVYQVKIEKYNQNKVDLKKETTRQKEIDLEAKRVDLDREKAAGKRAASEAVTARNIRKAVEAGGGKVAQVGEALKRQVENQTASQPASPVATATDGDEQLEKPEKVPSSAHFLAWAELVIGFFSGLESILAWIAIGTTLRQGTIRANAEHEAKVSDIRRAMGPPTLSLVERLGVVSRVAETEEGTEEYQSPLPCPTHLATVSPVFPSERYIRKDMERCGKIEDRSREIDEKEKSAPEMGSGFFLIQDSRCKKDIIFNVRRRTTRDPKGLLICRITTAELAEMQGASEEAWRGYLIQKVERANPKNREVVLKTIRMQLVA